MIHLRFSDSESENCFSPETQNTLTKEISRAQKAIFENNLGMARVCCRRAFGVAMDEVSKVQGVEKKKHTLAYLELFITNDKFPEDVRNAAQRLRAKRSDQDQNVSTDPINDLDVLLGFITTIIRNHQ